MKNVKKLPLRNAGIFRKKRVAAYARVSVGNDDMHHSLMAQIEYYNRLIQINPEWEYAGVYYDEGISGTKKAERKGFIKLMTAALGGQIDIILTKSISRFARNTVHLLESVRLLKEKGVEVRFEREGLSTAGGDGEFMMTILGAFAEEEAQSISGNIKWAIRKKFSQGIPHGGANLYGYERNGAELTVIPEEAEVVRLIYDNCIRGIANDETVRQLRSKGITGVHGKPFSKSEVRNILNNIIYTGTLLLQKEYVSDDIERKLLQNKGELPQYLVEYNHEAIINKEVFQKAQEVIAKREIIFRDSSIPIYPFTLKVKCADCGAYFVRAAGQAGKRYTKWICGNKVREGKSKCSMQNILESELERISREILRTDDLSSFRDSVKLVTVHKENVLKFMLSGGRIEIREWKPTDMSAKWTAEQRDECRKRMLSRKQGTRRRFSGKIACGICGVTYCLKKSRGSWWPGKSHKGCNVHGGISDEMMEQITGCIGLEPECIKVFAGHVIFELEGKEFRVRWKKS